MTINYPKARTVEQTDVYHGTTVRDPYRWLEDADSDETRAWITAENEITEAFLKHVPERDAIRERITRLWDYERFGLPYRRGDGRYFFTRNDGLQNQSVLYVAEGLDAPPRVLLDPNTLREDGTVALMGTAVSEDGRYLAYGLAEAGSDWMEWRVRDVDTGADRSDLVRWVKFSGASWKKDGSGFFYSRYDEPTEGQALQQANHFHKLYFHRLGDDQTEDVLVYDRPDQPEWNIHGSVTDDGQYLLIYVNQGTDRRNGLFYQDLTVGVDSPVVELLPPGDAQYGVIDNDGPVFYVRTDKDAPRRRVVAIDTRDPNPADWREVIPEAAETLEGVSLFGDEFIVTYLKDARTQVKVFGIDGAYKREIALPGIGSAGGFGGRREDTETFYAFSGYTTPTVIYRYDIASGTSEVYKKPQVAFDPDGFVTEQVFYHSKDGTRVPLFLTYKKGLQKNGANPTYLYGYGGFTVTLTPSFSAAMLAWMEMGGVYAVACLRGGSEYGEEWHEAGMKLKKQNVFDDFIAAAEYLIGEGYTSPPKLAIAGGSNGGLLVGACLNQRPALFGAGLPAVGVMDMIRFPKFTIGWAWKSDYGDPENPQEFAALYAYSPYHNLRPGTRYPAVLVTTSDHDDRVVPAHSFKYAAALQDAQAPDGPPTLIRIEVRAGHGAGKPTAKVIEEYADKFAFLAKTLGMELPGGFGV
jgi:prolyl oligopeptidase